MIGFVGRFLVFAVIGFTVSEGNVGEVLMVHLIEKFLENKVFWCESILGLIKI
jgi:hypothetical protein